MAAQADFLNRMLEAERAGARALVVFMDDWPRNGGEWTMLRRVHDEESHNCARIGKLLDKAGVPHSHATGEFYDKAVAVKDPRQRLAFLVRGLKWAVREFDAALERRDPPLDPAARELFAQMKASHLRSIAACEAVAGKLPPA